MHARAPGQRRPCRLTALALVAVSCGGPGRFPLRAPRWSDDDRRPHPRPPGAYWSPLVWDAADHTAFRPLSEALRVSTSGEAVDVNALDEVPDSTWYQNRLARRRLDPAEVAAGACAGAAPADDAAGAWTVLSGKANGATPGFIARGPDGARYIVKIGTRDRPEISEGADAVGSRLFWAAGYNTPCDRVAFLTRATLRIDPRARYKDAQGDARPLTPAVLDALLRDAVRDGRGRVRVGVSRFLPGEPLGPFRYEDRRGDDPNDHVPHEDRRELRAARVLSAWLNHWDSREQNTLTMWEPAGPAGGFVRHYLIDFSDIVGGYFPSDRINRQLGFSYYFDPQHFAEDFFSLGLIDRPWQHARVDPARPVFGYFRADDFVPDQWRGGYPNPAFERMTERDAAWMARILARLDDRMIAAAVAAARFSRPAWSEFLVRTLAARRDRILARYLTRVSPLADVDLRDRVVCARDRAVESGVYRRARYGVVARRGFAARASFGLHAAADGTVCVDLPPPSAAPAPRGADTGARYRVIELWSRAAGHDHALPLRIHLYDLGAPRGYALAGLER